jgi:ribosomal protein S18 acetylase RimI-like enzyme
MSLPLSSNPVAAAVLDALSRAAQSGRMEQRPALVGFRPAAPDEAAAIRDFVRAAYAPWVPVIGREPRPMTADYEVSVREHDFEIAMRDGRMIGLIETLLRDDHLWIENIAVAPEAQGQGIGTWLMERAEARGVAAGRTESRLVTNGKMDTNIALYKRRGYVVDREEPFQLGTAVYMKKALT